MWPKEVHSAQHEALTRENVRELAVEVLGSEAAQKWMASPLELMPEKTVTRPATHNGSFANRAGVARCGALRRGGPGRGDF
jgi:hypothetical protein